VSNSEWEMWPAAEHAERLLVRLGEELPELGLFRLPALADVLGVVTRHKECGAWISLRFRLTPMPCGHG
jgi:hypothetical protein